MDNFDIFLNPKDSLFKDEAIDILDVDGESWCLENDKLWNGSKYSLEDVEIDTDYNVDDLTYGLDSGSPSSEEMVCHMGEDPSLSPCSSSHSGSLSSSDQYEEMVNPNVKVVQLVGILPGGLKTIQILQGSPEQDEDRVSESVDSSPSPSNNEQSTHNNSYQELKLSEEEKRLLSKEGISLPSHHPLTKYEERELKRIRRKIRNKISAQDSRKRKKEYLDKLQQKVQEVEDEKTNLAKRVRTLETANAKLTAQVKRLNQMIAASKSNGGGSNVVPAATTLLVVILSLALVVLPTMQNKSKTSDIESSVLAAFEDANGSIVGRSRTMLGALTSKGNGHGFDELDELDEDEPLTKIPRFSFHQPTNGGYGSKFGIHRQTKNEDGLGAVKGTGNIGKRISLKGGKRSFQANANQIIDDEIDA